MTETSSKTEFTAWRQYYRSVSNEAIIACPAKRKSAILCGKNDVKIMWRKNRGAGLSTINRNQDFLNRRRTAVVYQPHQHGCNPSSRHVTLNADFAFKILFKRWRVSVSCECRVVAKRNQPCATGTLTSPLIIHPQPKANHDMSLRDSGTCSTTTKAGVTAQTSATPWKPLQVKH